MSNTKKNNKEEGLFDNVWTIPNLLSFIRILFIPVFAYLFHNEHMNGALVILILSALSDALDGKIARKFNQVSALGKLLDPVADKLTEITIAILLFIEFRATTSPAMQAFAWVFMFFLAKEAIMIIGGAIMLSKGIRPGAAEIYGKIGTFVFYVVMIIIICFGPEVGMFVRNNPSLALAESTTMILVVISAVLTFVALLSYTPGTFRQFKENKQAKINSDKK